MKYLALVGLLVVGVVQDFFGEKASGGAWDRYFLRTYMSTASDQNWTVTPVALTKDRGIKGIAVQISPCDQPFFLVPMVTGAEFSGVIGRFGQSVQMTPAYWFDGRKTADFPTLRFWLSRTVASMVPTAQGALKDELAVAFFAPEQCDPQESEFIHRLENVVAGTTNLSLLHYQRASAR